MPVRGNDSVQALQYAVKELSESNKSMREAVTLLHTAIFGRHDADPTRALPGMQDDVREMRSQISGIQKQLEKAEQNLGTTAMKVDRLRWYITGGMGVSVVILGGLDVFVRTMLHAFGAR